MHLLSITAAVYAASLMGTIVTRLGSVLRSHRMACGYTLGAVARHVGVALQTVHRWEAGTSCPSIETVCVLAELYGVSLASLFQAATAKKKRTRVAA